MLLLDDVFNRWSLALEEPRIIHVLHNDKISVCEHCGCDSAYLVIDEDTWRRIHTNRDAIHKGVIVEEFDLSEIFESRWQFLCTHCFKNRDDANYRQIVDSLRDDFELFVDVMLIGGCE